MYVNSIWLPRVKALGRSTSSSSTSSRQQWHESEARKSNPNQQRTSNTNVLLLAQHATSSELFFAQTAAIRSTQSPGSGSARDPLGNPRPMAPCRLEPAVVPGHAARRSHHNLPRPLGIRISPRACCEMPQQPIQVGVHRSSPRHP